jgi:hypothetical protein
LLDLQPGQARYTQCTRTPVVDNAPVAVAPVVGAIAPVVGFVRSALDYLADAWYAVAFVVGTTTALLSGSVFTNGIWLLILLGCPNMFPRLPWLAQGATLQMTLRNDVLGPRDKVAVVLLKTMLLAVIKYVRERARLAP